MSAHLSYTRVEFKRFKAFRSFSLKLRKFNVMVGPNNAGKSTVLAAFRMLAAGMRRARSRKTQLLPGPHGQVHGHVVDLAGMSVAAENIFHDYDDSEPASVVFHLSNGGQLELYFPSRDACFLFAEDDKGYAKTPAIFKSRFKCNIGYVPILGPLEQDEPMYQKAAATQALYSFGAARNFRNIWYHYPEHFDAFRELLTTTWPGMDVEPPIPQMGDKRSVLHMFCPESRIPREIFWAGFGFQVWCQMLTHLVQAKDCALFLIDEPDIYLHSSLQRQLVGLLRDLGPDILIATHSTEIISDADPEDIILVDKSARKGKRFTNASQLAEVFDVLGSALNPILTQLAKTRRVVFVEGQDFKLLSRLARKAGFVEVAQQTSFAVLPMLGFNPERAKNMKAGIEASLGTSVRAAVILDRDYRCDDEIDEIRKRAKSFCDVIVVHDCKEIENHLLVPAALDRAAERSVADRSRRTGKKVTYAPIAQQTLDTFSDEQKDAVFSQRASYHTKFANQASPHLDPSTVLECSLKDSNSKWTDPVQRLQMIPGKAALKALNTELGSQFSASLTATAIVEAMRRDEIPGGMLALLRDLTTFGEMPPL